MREVISCGIIPCRRADNGYEVFLVQLHAGHWGFPKGHQESGETLFETAKRELFEETRLVVSELLKEEPFEESYKIDKIPKKVYYYLSEVKGDAIIQSAEIRSGGWFALNLVEDRLTYPNLKALWVNSIIKKLS